MNERTFGENPISVRSHKRHLRADGIFSQLLIRRRKYISILGIPNQLLLLKMSLVLYVSMLICAFVVLLISTYLKLRGLKYTLFINDLQ